MVLKRPLQIFNGFWGDHHHWMFLGGLTIAINGFTMVFWCCYHRFQWFSMVPDHWSNDAMVSMDRCGLDYWLLSLVLPTSQQWLQILSLPSRSRWIFLGRRSTKGSSQRGWRSWTRAKLAPTRGVRFQVSSIVMMMTQIVMMMTQIVMVMTQIVMMMTKIVMMMTIFPKNTVFFKWCPTLVSLLEEKSSE